MTREFPAPEFPLAVCAQSGRSAAFVLAQHPLEVEAQFVVETGAFGRLLNDFVGLFQPATLLHVNGTEWRVETAPLSAGSALAITVRAACEFLGCAPTRNSVIARLLDAYPELEPRLRLVAQSRRRDDRVRAAQPLLAALIVAHAASVAHLVKHG
jgi:hypothetical protein